MSATAKVEMYIKDGCPFCLRAKALLERKGASIQEYPAARDEALFARMQERSGGGRTFPQIFINDQHIGGCDDLHALDARGELDTLL